MDLDLKDRLALVSGSTAGIGLAIAEALAREGARVIVNGRTQGAVDAVVNRLQAETGTKVQGFAGDLTAASQAEALVQRFPGVEILVNNLGIFEPKAFEDIPDADWTRFFEANVLSGVRLARLCLPAMRQANWGRIIFISSESALQIPLEMIHYGMTKSAQIAVARGLAEAVAGTGITVNSVLPGADALARRRGLRRGPGGERRQDLRRLRKRILRKGPPHLSHQALRHARRGSVLGGLCGQSPGLGDDRRCAAGVDGGVVKSAF